MSTTRLATGIIGNAHTIDPARLGTVAVVGSPSTTTSLTLNVLRAAYTRPLYGRMIALAVPTSDGIDHGWELALGTVTQVETTNPSHTARAPEAPHIADQGVIEQSGDDGDTRALAVSVEAVFRHDREAGPTARTWQPAGSTLSTSPATGTPVTLMTGATMDELMQGVPGVRCVGHLRGTSIDLPWTDRDFASARGARHDAVLGQTGSGKTGAATLLMAADLFHDNLGQIVFDPQGQWATEHGTVFSLQGLAAALGRTVTVARLSRSLRLDKDAGMLADLLAKAGLLGLLTMPPSALDQIAAACRVMADALRDYDGDWTEADPGDVLTHLLTVLRDALATGIVYAGREGANRVRWAIRRPSADECEDEGMSFDAATRLPAGVLDDRDTDGRRWAKALATFAPLHNLFSPWTPTGAARLAQGTPRADMGPADRRTRVWPLLHDVISPRLDAPAPWLILDLSVDPPTGVDRAADEADPWEALDDPGVKARIMRSLLADVERVGLGAFKSGQPLNVRITWDEAWQWAGPPMPGMDRDVVALSDKIAAGCRDLRKIGMGLRFITQTATSLREDVWKQLATRVVGYGLTDQSDTRRLANIVGDTHMSLYLSMPGPEATGRYPFMVSGGGVTGLSFGARPVFVDMHTSGAAWLAANEAWVSQSRRRWAKHLPAGDGGGALRTVPPRPRGADEQVEAMVGARALHDGRANAAAAARLGESSGKRQAFGTGTGVRAVVPVSAEDYGPPPF